ncbi:MAG: hypothetical protein GX287_03390 [Fusobacteria bacterium]|nr:hypothetical protein [Fusobacteriota bacterium]
MFKYRFKKALEHYEQLEKDAGNELVKKNNEIKDKEHQIDLIKNQIINIKDDLIKILSGRLDIQRLNHYQQYIELKNKELLSENENLKQLIVERNDIEKDYFEKREQRKIFEKLKEKHYEKYLKEQEIEEQKLIDEITNSMYNRS